MPRTLSVVLTLALLVAGSAGCAGDSPSPTAAATTAAPSPSPSPSDDDPPGSLTCHLLVAASTDGTLMEPGVVDAITAAAATADAPLVDAARRLAGAYAGALAAKGAANEPDAVAAVSAAGVDMAGVCDDSGLETVG
jgi:hypothetical protein